MDTLDPPIRLLSAFQDAFPESAPAHIIQAPGREMWIAASDTYPDAFSIHAPDLTARTSFNWRTAKFKQTVLKRPLPQWARYPAGVVVDLCARNLDVTGFEAVVVGEETHGPRYDYALGMTVAALLHAIHQREYSAQSLIDILERVHKDYING